MTNKWLDQAKNVRPGEELDKARLLAYLKDHLPDLNGPLIIKQFPSGFSNLTYLLQIGERGLVLRRPPLGVKIKSAHDMGREYHILSHLSQVYPKIPQTLHYCEDEAIIGAPFYLMKRLTGIILRPEMPVAMNPSPDLMGRIADSFIDTLVELHAVDYQAAGLGDLGRPAGYIERQIGGWSKRYQNARTDDVPDIERVATWLQDHKPTNESDETTRASLIHNDYKYNNLMLDPQDWTHVMAILDWEMSTLGNPLMDLGTTLGYWVEADDHEIMHTLDLSPTTLPGNPSREALAERYSQKSGQNIDHLVFYYVYGLFKVAVIIQQIYRRFKLGHTQDQRFAQLDQAVKVCGITAGQAIEKGRINQLFT